MKKKSLILVAIILAIIALLPNSETLAAQSDGITASITSDLAKQAATIFLDDLQRTEMRKKGQSSARHISQVRHLADEDGNILAYVIVLNPDGYIVTSSDTDIRPVIAYSLNGNFPFEDSPDNLLLHTVLRDMKNRNSALLLVSAKYKEKTGYCGKII